MKKCFPFFHKYELIRAEEFGICSTLLMYVCERCKKPYRKIIEGRFKLEDFKKKEN